MLLFIWLPSTFPRQIPDMRVLDYHSIEVSRWKNLPPPPGFAVKSQKRVPVSASARAEKSTSYAKLKEKRAWELAISPAKSLPMQAIMLYMSGGGVQIFSMGIVAMLLLSPFKAAAGMNTAFAPFAPEGSDSKAFSTLLLQKLAYMACNLLTLALGMYKCSTMGLLPTGTADWLAFETRGKSPDIVLM